MDARSFDIFTRRLTTGLPRREVFALLAGVASSLLIGGERTVAGCKKVGKKCDKNKDCCDGARCKGGKKGNCRCKSGLDECGGKCKNLDNDSQHCSACNNACPAFIEFCVAGVCESCPAGADHCASPGASCQNDPGCFCLKRLEDGKAVCADLPRCDEPCSDESDCPGGPSICVSAGEECCPGSAGQGRCAEVCGA